MILRSSLRPDLDAELLAFHGELDLTSAPDLAARISEVIEGAEGALLVDLTGCIFIDSAGISALVDAARSMQKQGRRVAVAVSSSQVRRTLVLTGIDALVPIGWTRDETVTLLSSEIGAEAGGQ